MQLSAIVASEELRLEIHAGSHASSSASRSGQPVSPRGMPPNRHRWSLLSPQSYIDSGSVANRHCTNNHNETASIMSWVPRMQITIEHLPERAADLVEINSGGSVHFCFFEPAASRCRMSTPVPQQQGHQGQAAAAEASPAWPHRADRPASAEAHQARNKHRDLQQSPPSGGAVPVSPAAGLSLEAPDALSSCPRSSPSRSSASPAGRGPERCLSDLMAMRAQIVKKANASIPHAKPWLARLILQPDRIIPWSAACHVGS